MATGVEINRETRNFSRNGFAGQAGTNFLNPDPWRFGGTLQSPTSSQYAMARRPTSPSTSADQIKINRYFELLGSIRVENYKFEQDGPRARGQHQQPRAATTIWSVGASAACSIRR